ncbi:MAG: GNAT family N-acetyltransferase [Streptomyces sp.]|nr:GNAT family N-acetyltransferase [Streptomyces sp.]
MPTDAGTVEVGLVPVAEADRTTLADLLQLHLQDMSEVRGTGATARGTFPYPYFDAYFGEAGREACLVTADGDVAGFSMTRRLPDGSREMSEFFVLRRHRRRGVGGRAAAAVLRRHPGPWTLCFDHANHAAARFWPGVVSRAAAGPVHRRDRLPPDVAHASACLRFDVRPAGAAGGLA